ncbi:MAG: TylF/MycF/NovP-related O-methyltransferase [Chloroflexota bacterium]
MPEVDIVPLPTQRGVDAKYSSLPHLTLAVASRLLYFQRMLELAADVPGDIVECGVGWGRSLLDLSILARLEERGRQLWGFDSFEGFPEPTQEDSSSRHVKRGEWRTDLRSVLEMLSASGLDSEFIHSRITLIKGFFKDSLPLYHGGPIALLHVDVDLYQSYTDVLTLLYPRVAPGGVVLFDEFLNTLELEKFPGARKAIQQYFQGKQDIKRDTISGKYYTVKEA